MVHGVSDTPYSLMEGASGEICLYTDFLSPNPEQVKFPGYEL